MKSWRNSKDMRLVAGLTIITLICSCGPGKENGTNSLSIESDSIENRTATSQNEIDMKVANLDSLISDQIKVLDTKYASTPFYAEINGEKFFIVCSGVHNYRMDRFSGELKYGIVDESFELILNMSFDKIYNPDLTIRDCFEIRKGKKIGLYNYKTKELLEPEFEFICPASDEATNVGYGYRNGSWFEINNGSLKGVISSPFNPQKVIEKLAIRTDSLGESMMYDSYYRIYENDMVAGKGVFIAPSFVEAFNLLPNSIYEEIVLPDRREFDYGIELATVKTNESRSLSDGLIAFFLSAFESGIDARGYIVESEKIMIYNSKSQAVNAIEIPIASQYGYLCKNSDHRVINDSIIETNSNFRTRLDGLYDFENKYSYFQILRNGKIKKLESDRHFDFTKFVIIDENYFKGCFGKLMDEADWENQKNVWRTDHLTIDDLDLMRNEIFAEYGYIFKSEKWTKYFSGKSWYRPRFENVDNFLSDIDKSNIKTILRVTQMMKGKESEFINRRPDFYYEGP